MEAFVIKELSEKYTLTPIMPVKSLNSMLLQLFNQKHLNTMNRY